MGDYLSFYKETDKSPNASNIFDFDGYLDSLRPANRCFMEEMAKTQMFANFIEKSHMALTKHNELLYFVKAAKRLQSGDKKMLEKDLKAIYIKLIDNYKHVTTCITNSPP